MSTVTVGGGHTVRVIDAGQANLLQSIIDRVMSYKYPDAYASLNPVTGKYVGEKGYFNMVYNIPDMVVNAGANATEIVDDLKGDRVLNGGQTKLIIAKYGDDTISTKINGTVYAGRGADSINLNGGTSDFVILGNKADTVNVNAASITELNVDGQGLINNLTGGDLTLKLYPDSHVTLAGGMFKIQAKGNDTITFGPGASGSTHSLASATIYGGAGTLKFTGNGGDDKVVAGSGATTLFGGSGKEFFSAGNEGASVSMHGGAGGADTFVGGTGSDTLNAGSAATVDFDFAASAAGGSHVVYGFTHGSDTLHFSGYSLTNNQIFADAAVVGGNTVLTLGDGTTITLVGFTDLKHSDIK
jgi:Ca2+-binding RTX toxin-like protein